MTARVFDCQPSDADQLRARQSRALHADDSRGGGFGAAALVSLLVVPLAGAAEPPIGWLAGGLSALAVLLIVLSVGSRVRWGWLALLAAGAGLFLPRGQLGAIGPGLLVTTLLCVVLWFSNRKRNRRRTLRGPRPGSREHMAQLVLGISGERHASHLLANGLSEEFVLINGLKLPRAAGDIDHLVVGPTGVFLLETKTMAGEIICEPDGTWRRRRVGRAGTEYAAYIGDPALQVQRNIFAVRECLRRRLPGLVRRLPLWIEGVVVFAHPHTELHAEHSRVPAVLLEQAPARICEHVPSRRLRPADVAAVVRALLDEAQLSEHAASAQATVELALALPVVLALVFGAVALSRLVQAQAAVVTVAHEAARAGALAQSPDDAIERMHMRTQLVAANMGLDPASVVLDLDATRFAQDPGQVTAIVHYPVDFRDVPLAGWLPAAQVEARHVEWVDPYRSGVPAPPAATE